MLCQAATLFCALAIAGTGDWPEPRQNAHLTGVQPMPGKMTAPPAIVAEFDLGRSQPNLSAATLPDGSVRGLAIWGGALYCYDINGAQQWVCHPPGLNFASVKATGDLDGDGSVEIVLDAGRPGNPYGAAALVALLDGTLVWRYDVEPMSYAWYLYVDKYLPNDDKKQIVVLMHAYPPDPKNGYMAMFDFAESGKPPRQRWRYDFDAYTCFPSLLQTDLEGDGARELVVETHSRMWVIDTPTGILKQFYSWDVSPGNMRSYGLVKFADLNGDALDDFLCVGTFAQHHEVLLNENGRFRKAWHYGWPESVTTGKVATVWAEPPHADIDGDGKQEVIVSMYNSENDSAWLLRIYNAVTGELKYRMPGVIATSGADIDGDGVGEVLVNVCDDPTKTVTRGARLFRIRDGKFDQLWQDDSATAVLPALRTNGRRKQNPPEAMAARITKDGETFELDLDAAGKVTVSAWSKPPKEDRPQFQNVPAIAGAPVNDLLSANLIGDHRNELVVYQSPKVTVLSLADGNLVPVHEYQSSSVPVIADLNGDGANELVLSHAKADTLPRVEAVTPSTGVTLWDVALPAPDRPGLPHSRDAYLRAGKFTGKSTPDLYAWFGTPMGRSLVIDGANGSLVWERGEVPDSERFWGATVNHASVYDFNADGKDDLVFTNPDYYCIANGPTGEFLLGPAYPPEVFKQPSQGLYTFPALLTKTAGNPDVALVNGHYFQAAMSIKAAPAWYALPVPGEARVACEGFLQLADGTWLMGFGRQNGKFACINAADGSLRWELPVEASTSDTITCDVNGDTQFEFVFGSSHGTLYAVTDDSGTSRRVWSLDVNAGFGPLIAADLDADGASEIVAALFDGRIAVFGSK